MGERDSSEDIDRAASDWTARLDRGSLTRREEEEFQAWLTDDRRSRGALLRAQSLSMMSESARALGPDFDPAPFAQRERHGGALSRRRMLAWTGGSAVAASLVALGVGVPASGAVIATGRGEIRLVPLKDGSTVLLNTDSSIRVYDRSERLVVLVGGEALFSVARGGRYPFVVEVDGRRLSTEAAEFRVRKLVGEPVEVLVRQGGIVLPTGGQGSSARAVALGPDTRLVLSDPAATPLAVSSDTVVRELAWRDGKLAFEGESLKQAADAFARYSNTRIVIPDRALAREPVTGLFAANDPVGFSRAISRVFDARLVQDGNAVIIARAISDR